VVKGICFAPRNDCKGSNVVIHADFINTCQDLRTGPTCNMRSTCNYNPLTQCITYSTVDDQRSTCQALLVSLWCIIGQQPWLMIKATVY